MQQLQIRRLSPQESAKEHQEFFFESRANSASIEIPETAKIGWVCKYLGKTDRTVGRYRKLLFEHCYEYQTLTCINGIDSRFLRRRQIELLKEFNDLVAVWKDVEFSLHCYNVEHPSPSDVAAFDN